MDWEKYYEKPKEDKIDLIVEWRTNKGVYNGIVKDWTAFDYVVEVATDDTNITRVTVPKKCCRVIKVIYC